MGDGSESLRAEMLSQQNNDAFDLSVRTEAAYLSAFDELRRSRVAFFVVLCKLGKTQLGRVQGLLATFLYFAQKFFDKLSRMGSTDSLAFDVAPLPKFVSEGDTRKDLLLESEDRSGAWLT